MTSDDNPALAVRCPADLIAAVPYLLGFHPADSLAAVGMRGARIVFAARYDLPAATDRPDVVDAQARHVADVVARQGVDAATVVGYGPPGRVTPAVRALAGSLRSVGVEVFDELRVTGGRFWSYRCQDPLCCPAEGTRCHPPDSVIDAAATFAGQVALPDRAALAARLASVTGAQRVAMRAATDAAVRRRHELLSSAPASDVLGGRSLRRAGEATVHAAVRRHRAGSRLTDEEVAWLGVLLTHLPVRDRVWEQTGDDDWHVTLWTDVVRRVEPEYLAAPASLLAFAAWRAGHGALASVAVQRAREQDPDYPMAVLVEEVLRHGLPPTTVSGWPAGRRRVGRARPRRSARRDRTP